MLVFIHLILYSKICPICLQLSIRIFQFLIAFILSLMRKVLSIYDLKASMSRLKNVREKRIKKRRGQEMKDYFFALYVIFVE